MQFDSTCNCLFSTFYIGDCTRKNRWNVMCKHRGEGSVPALEVGNKFTVDSCASLPLSAWLYLAANPRLICSISMLCAAILHYIHTERYPADFESRSIASFYRSISRSLKLIEYRPRAKHTDVRYSKADTLIMYKIPIGLFHPRDLMVLILRKC